MVFVPPIGSVARFRPLGPSRLSSVGGGLRLRLGNGLDGTVIF